MRVTLEAALGVTVGLLVAGKVPDKQRLVATAREQHVGAKVQEELVRNRPRNVIHSINQSIKSINPHSTPTFFFFLVDEISYRIGTLLLQRGSQASNPAIVALKGTAKDQLLSHDRGVRKVWEEETMKGDRERTRSERGRSRAIVVVLSAAVSTR